MTDKSCDIIGGIITRHYLTDSTFATSIKQWVDPQEAALAASQPFFEQDEDGTTRHYSYEAVDSWYDPSLGDLVFASDLFDIFRMVQHM